jgi:ribosomal protein S18 acetylase RimI-like enzyme
MEIRLRPITPEDQPFLYGVYAGTRKEELSVVNWTEEQKAAFLTMQFNAQHRHYQEYCPKAKYDVILCDGEPAGRLYVDRREAEIHVIDISLLPDYRGRGIGSKLLGEIIAEAAGLGKAVSIEVERNNRALGLYLRLGFTPVKDLGVYLSLERKSDAMASESVDTLCSEGRT